MTTLMLLFGTHVHLACTLERQTKEMAVSVGVIAPFAFDLPQLPSNQHTSFPADISGGYLSSLLAPGSPSVSVPPSPLVAELQDKAGESFGSSHSSSTARDAGPRIFVGKLVRGTTESDVRDYFSKFGYVLTTLM